MQMRPPDARLAARTASGQARAAPGHADWQSEFIGTTGLFCVAFHPRTHDQIRAFVDALYHFGIAVSWGENRAKDYAVSREPDFENAISSAACQVTPQVCPSVGMGKAPSCLTVRSCPSRSFRWTKVSAPSGSA